MTLESLFRKLAHIFGAPETIACVVYFMAVVWVRPWGDFPLNDDWSYAHVTRVFAETGRLKINVPIAPAIVGQVMMATPLIWLLGFSHTLLRVLTILLAMACLFLLGKTMRLLHVGTIPQLFFLLVVLFNPLFFYFSTTFMTEIYAIVPALLACYLWFRDRSRHKEEEGSLLSYRTVCMVAFLAGVSFVTRQLCGILLPCLYASLLCNCLWSGKTKRLRKSIPQLLLGILILGVMIKGYFIWGEQTRNLRPEFTDRFSEWLQFDPASLKFFMIMMLVYVTSFLAPLLILTGIQTVGQKPRLDRATAFAVVMLWMALWVYFIGMQQEVPMIRTMTRNLNEHFPYLGNVVRNAGMGPITLTDAYCWRTPGSPDWLGPSWPQWIWNLVLIASCLLSGLWILLLKGVKHPQRPTWHHEMRGFGLWLAFGNASMVAHMFKFHVFDRYLFLSWIGALFCLMASLPDISRVSKKSVVWAAGILALLPMACFSVGGVFDEFRFHEARWAIFRESTQMGINPFRVDGGYEINGWNSFEGGMEHASLKERLRPRKCPDTWYFCHQSNYRIGLKASSGDQVVLQKEIPFILGRHTAIFLFQNNNIQE